MIPVRDQRQAHELVGLVDSMAAGPEAVPAIVAAPGQPPLPAEPPEPLGALRIVRRARVWRLLFNRWAAGASGSAIASVLLLVVATAGVLVGLR